MKPYPAVFFDLDDTLIEGYMGEQGKPIHDYARVVALPRRIERLALLIQHGIKIGIASNQGGVGLGLQSLESTMDKRNAIRTAFDFPVFGDAAIPVLMCYYHPSRPDSANFYHNATFRKPAPGMLLELANLYKLSPAECLFVGDRPEDQQAAANAGMDFCHADIFFSTETIRPMNTWPIPMREERPEGKTLLWTLIPEAKYMTGMRNGPDSGPIVPEVANLADPDLNIVDDAPQQLDRAEFDRIGRRLANVTKHGLPTISTWPRPDPLAPGQVLGQDTTGIVGPPSRGDLGRSMTNDEIRRFGQLPGYVGGPTVHRGGRVFTAPPGTPIPTADQPLGWPWIEI
jgi:D-glycero-D-manno-heptose 1,7-bisphosphate phosphatase